MAGIGQFAPLLLAMTAFCAQPTAGVDVKGSLGSLERGIQPGDHPYVDTGPMVCFTDLSARKMGPSADFPS